LILRKLHPNPSNLHKYNRIYDITTTTRELQHKLNPLQQDTAMPFFLSGTRDRNLVVI